MIIIVEGPDKAGKSTLINSLSKEFPGFLIKITDRPVSNSEEEKQKILAHYMRVYEFMRVNKDQTFILDRYFPSEMVYSLKRKYEAFDGEFFKLLEDRILGHKHLLILCDPGEEELERRMKETPDDYVSIAENLEFAKRYNRFFEKTKLRKIRLDTTKPVEELVKLIKEMI